MNKVCETGPPVYRPYPRRSIAAFLIVLYCIVSLIYCYVDIIQYNAMHKFVRVLDNPRYKVFVHKKLKLFDFLSDFVLKVVCI